MGELIRVRREPHAASCAVAETPRRIVQSQPEGRYAKTDIGYMVPYSVRIPGSDAGFEMVPVPGGEWHLESNDPSAPMLKVRVEPFWIGKYEVTWKEFFEYMASHQQFRLQRVANATNDSVDAVTSPTALYSPELVLEYARTERLPCLRHVTIQRQAVHEVAQSVARRSLSIADRSRMAICMQQRSRWSRRRIPLTMPRK